MRRSRPGPMPRRLAAALLLAAAALAPATTPTSAALPGHSGTRGVHQLIDTTEYPAIICQYELLAPGYLKRVSVRRPIVYAPDLTAGRDHRWVGWRYRIQRSTDETTWTTVATSKIQRAVAYDDQPAALQPSGKNLTGVSGDVYRALVDLWWYTPSGTRTITGRARHTNDLSLVVFDSTETYVNGPCAGSVDPVALAAARGDTPTGTSPAGPPPTHDGNVGLHTLVNTFREYPGAICRLEPDGDVRISVRAPAVFAREGFSGSQRVRWRYTIDGLASSVAGVPGAFSFTSPWDTSTASEDRAARWAPLRTRTIANPQWPYYVVSVRIEWLDDGLPHAFAVHGPFHKNGTTVTGYCFGAL